MGRHLDPAVADGVGHADIVVPGPVDAEPQGDAGHAGFADIFVDNAPSQANDMSALPFLFIVRERAARLHCRPPEPTVHGECVGDAVVGADPARILFEVAKRQRPACRPVRTTAEENGFLGNLGDCDGAGLGTGSQDEPWANTGVTTRPNTPVRMMVGESFICLVSKCGAKRWRRLFQGPLRGAGTADRKSRRYTPKRLLR